METHKKGLTVVFLLLVAFLLTSSPASAAYFYDGWSSAQKVTDPAGDTTFAGRDILAAYHAYSSGYHYFRIDLASAPSSHFPPGYADTYGLYIDSRVGGAPSYNSYVPGAAAGIGPLSGIDFIVSSELDIEKCNRVDWDPDRKVWKVDEFNDSSNLKFQASMNGGKTLEWQVKDGQGAKQIGNSFTWWAGTMDPGYGFLKKTYDLTSASVAPIPSAAWLLGSGIVGLIGLKRRKDRTNNG